jgi:hypothetical protein
LAGLNAVNQYVTASAGRKGNGRRGFKMYPPIDRDNLRDVLIALAVAVGLAWAVGVFQGCRPGFVPAAGQLALSQTAP